MVIEQVRAFFLEHRHAPCGTILHQVLYHLILPKLQAKQDNVTQIVAHIIAWGLVAPVLDIVMYAEPANKVFLQGLGSAAINAVATAIVGTLLLFAYAAAKPKKGSLKKED